jgi:CheY-like chemotaxis protein
MLKSGRLNPQQQARALEVIARSARTQADLIEDLLDVSRIITGKLAIDLRPIGCAAPLRAALDAVRPTAEAKGIRLERRVDIDSPVLGDPDRLQQVAWNLLSNAIKFTPAGGTVAVSLERHDGQVELKVRDTGMGISPAFLPHVFERFKQYDSSTTRSHGGMGLGLAIVRHLVEAHGGSVRAESEGEGHGATFVVRLPVHAAGASLEATAAGGGGPLVSADAELSGLRALVVDDDEDARELMSSVLAAHGAEVKTAASAEEALQILDREAVDILLADIGMPGTDGYGLMRSVRSHPSERVRNLPAVAVTAYAGERDRDAALAAGFQAHVAKPIDLDSLHVIVRRLATTTN